MSKQITATELAAIVTKLLTGESGEVDGFESFQGFMTDIARVVCDYCGGEVRTDAAPVEDAWIVVIHGDDRLPDAFGGIWREDDPKGTLFEQETVVAPGPVAIATGVSTSSTFATDGYRDARAGVPASPPTHPGTTVLAGEYMIGYRNGMDTGTAAASTEVARQDVAVEEALRELVDAVEYPPLGIPCIKVVQAAKAVLLPLPASPGARLVPKYVIFSQSEAEATSIREGFWSNEGGWGDYSEATRFSEAEKEAFALPESAGSDAKWATLASLALFFKEQDERAAKAIARSARTP